MKKILFASTALFATAGVAAADYSFGGYGRFGVYHNSGAGEYEQETRIEQRFRATMTATAETDGGVKLEGRFRFQADDNAEGGADGAGPGAAGFAVSFGGLRVDVGHISDALDSGDVVDFYGYGVGLTGFIEQADAFGGFDANGFGNGGTVQQKVKVKYSVGDFTLSASYAQENKDDPTDEDVDVGGVTVKEGDAFAASYYQVGASYDFGTFAVGALYGEQDITSDDDSYWIVGMGGSIAAISYNVTIGEAESVDETAVGLSAKYALSESTSLTAVYASTGVSTDDDVYGLGFSHGLGGGVTLAGGVGQESDGETQADFGVKFSF